MMTTLVLLSLLSAAPPPAFQPKNRPYDAQHYRLDFRLEDDGAFKNKVTARLKAIRPLTEIELDAYDFKIEMVLVDGAAADFKLKYDPGTRTGTMTIKAPKPVAAGKETTVEISYSGKAGTGQSGFYSVRDPEDENALPMYFTQFEPMDAQRFLPCNDQPADKATAELFAVVDARYQVVSNGTKDKDETFAEGGKTLRRVHWKQEKPISPYLFAVAVGQLEAIEISPDVPSTLWAAPGRKDRAFITVDSLRDLLRFETALAGGVKYPWAKLDVVAVPRFFWGGMENASVIFNRDSLTVLDHKNEQLSRPEIVGTLAHEMAHQWFGDLVTCAWWDDTWLNEGFATYLGGLAAEEYLQTGATQIDALIRLQDHYFREEDGPHAHPLVSKTATPEDSFDAVSYVKGAAVLGMLDAWVGREDFKKSLKAYLDKYALQAATSEDFFKVVGETTKKQKELGPFKDAWLKKKGYPVIFPEASYEGGKLKVTIRQQPNRADEKGPFVFKLPIVIHRALEPAFEKAETILVDKPSVTVTLDVPAAPGWINWNKGGTALVKVNAPSLSEEQWADSARSDPDPTWRLLAAWTLLGDLGSRTPKTDALPSDTAQNAVLDVLAKDPNPYVRVAVMDRLARGRFKKLPTPYGPLALSLAKRPENLNEDPIGYIMVRSAGMELLARTDNADGHKYLLDELGKREIDINYLPAFAAGAARLNTPAALVTLRSAVSTQRARGHAYYKRTVTAFGAVRSTEVVPVLKELFKANATDDEVLGDLLDALDENDELRESVEYAALVRDLGLDESLDEDLRAALLRTTDDVKTAAMKEALSQVLAKTGSERLKLHARQTLEVNFPAPAAKEQKKK